MQRLWLPRGQTRLAQMCSDSAPAEIFPFSLRSQGSLACSIDSQLVLVGSIVTSRTSLRGTSRPLPHFAKTDSLDPSTRKGEHSKRKGLVALGEACESPALCFFWSTKKDFYEFLEIPGTHTHPITSK